MFAAGNLWCESVWAWSTQWSFGRFCSYNVLVSGAFWPFSIYWFLHFRQILLTNRPSTSKDENLPKKYYVAEQRGRNGESCEKAYGKECPNGIFDLITTIKWKLFISNTLTEGNFYVQWTWSDDKTYEGVSVSELHKLWAHCIKLCFIPIQIYSTSIKKLS